MGNRTHKALFSRHLIKVGDIVKGLKLPLLGALAVVHMEKMKFPRIVLLLRDGGGDARVHSSRNKDNGFHLAGLLLFTTRYPSSLQKAGTQRGRERLYPIDSLQPMARALLIGFRRRQPHPQAVSCPPSSVKGHHSECR